MFFRNQVLKKWDLSRQPHESHFAPLFTKVNFEKKIKSADGKNY